MKKTLEELNVIDNFMFNELIMQEDAEKSKQFCRIILEPVLNRKIRNIEIFSQKIFQGTDTSKHGIQIDAYIKETVEADGEIISDVNVSVVPNIYLVEPNTYKASYKEYREGAGIHDAAENNEKTEKINSIKGEIIDTTMEARRSRYYHSLVDSHIFETGKPYSELPNVIIIMILPYDPFGLDRMMYTIENRCIEEPEMDYHDGAKTIYLYTRGRKNIPRKSLKDMLLFVEKSTSENAISSELSDVMEMMDSIKHNAKIGVKYMHTLERERAIRDAGYDNGYDNGYDEGKLLGKLLAYTEMGLSMDDISKRISLPVDEVKKMLEDNRK